MKIEVLKGSKTSREILTMIRTHAYIKTLYMLLSLFYYELQHNFDEWNNIVNVENGIDFDNFYTISNPSHTFSFIDPLANTRVRSSYFQHRSVVKWLKCV